MSNIIQSESGLAESLNFAGLNLKKSEEQKLTKMSKQLTIIVSTETALDKEINALRRKIANNPDMITIKRLKSERKNLKRINSQLSDNISGALEIMLCDYEPNLTLYEKIKKLNMSNRVEEQGFIL